jgi:GNAT superfamily N-acetyltransferase
LPCVALGEPGRCQPTFAQKLRIVAKFTHGCGVTPTSRALRWLGNWPFRDPRDPHWYLGPLAVDAHLRGHGIGSQLLGECCKLLDTIRAAGCLETDKEANVRSYRKFGFETISDSNILGTPNMVHVPLCAVVPEALSYPAA